MNNLRHLPAVHQLQRHDRFLRLVSTFHISEKVLTNWLSEQIDVMRNKMLANQLQEDMTKDELTNLIFDQLEQSIHMFENNNLQAVINATGVVLHTNLGRARLSKQAIQQISRTASSYSTLEYDVETGSRGSRHDIVEEYLKQLTNAEAAMVVNNNAAAVHLILKAIGNGKEVIVSRGELVEIGGSFRISEIMEESQVDLVEVGTTNKTHVRDYVKNITEDTSLLMKVHKSNFNVVGFTEEVDTKDLAQVARQYQIPIYEDLGSGTLFDFKKIQIGQEPTVREKVEKGIDLLSFSGDKLLGGPQAGIIVGKKELINQLKAHQLARVLRVDKFTLAGLEATLKAYRKGMETEEIPVVRDMLETSDSILKKIAMFEEKITFDKTGFVTRIEKGTSKVGGGTMPEVEIDTYIVAVTHDVYTSEGLAKALRKHRIPIIVRVKKDAVILDFRTVHDEEVAEIIEAFLHL